jgi:hypothetical protein
MAEAPARKRLDDGSLRRIADGCGVGFLVRLLPGHREHLQSGLLGRMSNRSIRQVQGQSGAVQRLRKTTGDA